MDEVAQFVTVFVRWMIEDCIKKVYSYLDEKEEEFEAQLQLHPMHMGYCIHNILCECQRRHCPGRTVTIATYVRRIERS